jgi:ATP-dependent DNA helicase RecG
MPENQNIEWKESWRDEYLGWICGFANACGGKIYIGINDLGEVIGLKNPEKLLKDIPNKIQSFLGIICDVNIHKRNRKPYIEIIIKPQTVAISFRGEYHYRSGATKQVLRGQALIDFLLRKTGRTWDDVVESRAKFDDISQTVLDDFKEGAYNSNRVKSIKKDKDIKITFANLRLIENNQLKRAGVILFANDPKKFFINSYIKIGRFELSETDLKFQDIIEGPAYKLADMTLEILQKKYLVSQISYQGLQRIETTEYPLEALREIILNAIVHKDYTGAPIQIKVYDDKIMIWNEGTLPEELKIEDLKKEHPSKPRNQLIADIFFKGGMIETWGRGTLKITEECKINRLPEPNFDIKNGGISVTLFKNIFNEEHLKRKGLTKRQIKAILYVKESGKITNSEYQKLTDVSKTTATRELNQMVDEFKLLIKIGETGKGTFYYLKGS